MEQELFVNTSILQCDGSEEKYDRTKIISSMQKSFQCTERAIPAEALSFLLSKVEFEMLRASASSSREIRDIVERVLMKAGYFEEAKAYILRHECPCWSCQTIQA